MSGLYADEVSGDTREGLAFKIGKLSSTVHIALFLISACCIYYMNVIICSSYEKYFGNGGFVSHNAAQFLCAYCTL